MPRWAAMDWMTQRFWRHSSKEGAPPVRKCHAKKVTILGVHWDQTVGVPDINFSQKSPTALLHDEIYVIIAAGKRECEVVASDPTVNTISCRVQQIHNEPPLAWDKAESADLKDRKGRQRKGAGDLAKCSSMSWGFWRADCMFWKADWSLEMQDGRTLKPWQRPDRTY